MRSKRQSKGGSRSAPRPDLVPVKDDERGRIELLQETGKFPPGAYRNMTDKNRAVGCLLWFSHPYNRDQLRKPPDNFMDAQIDNLWRDLLKSCIRLKVPFTPEQKVRAKRLGVLK